MATQENHLVNSKRNAELKAEESRTVKELSITGVNRSCLEHKVSRAPKNPQMRFCENQGIELANPL